MKNFIFSVKKTLFKYLNICIIIIALGISIQENIAQKVVIIGVNYSNGVTRNDAVAFVATEILPINTVIYFTDYEYMPNAIASQRKFGDSGAGTTTESAIKYTVTTQVPKGTVISLRFSSPMTTGDFVPITMASSNGTVYGTAAFLQTINGVTTNINYRSGGESIYAYSDADDNPVNGITEIFSVFYVGSESLTNAGGNIPTNESPVPDFPNAVVVDGFTFTAAELDLVEFTANRSNNTSKATLENPSNYTTTANAALNPNVTAFTNIFPSAVLPILTVSTSATSIIENAAGTITYTFTLNGPAAGNVTVNFNVTGTAVFNTDYTQSGAATFSTTTGTITILNGATSASLTIDPTPESLLEPNETVILTVQSVAGVYDAGNPSAATITINNDDTGASSPKVALVGINQADAAAPTNFDGFSFVALSDITAGTIVYFTRRIYDKTTLAFGNTFTGTVKWTAAAGVNRGDVFTVMETSADAFTITCSDGGSCGTITNLDAGFSIPTGGITLFAYSDNNDVPTDAITEIYSALHTGDITVASNGGAILAISNPASVYPNAVVKDNFPNAVPGRVEYKFPAERLTTVSRSLLLTTANWLHAQSTATALSTLPFTNIIVTSGVANPLVTVTPSPISVLENSGSGMIYTFTLSQNAASNMTINYTVTGSAIFGTDYTQTGAAGFTASTGSVVIPSGSNTASVTITPVADATLEPNETVVLTIDISTGYDAGNPNVGTGTITNDDIVNVNPLVVIVGVNHGTSPDPDGISFAANQNLTAGTEIYFTDSPYNNTTLNFSTIESITKYTVPVGGLAKGQVVYVVETGQLTNVFTVSCSSGANCGTFTFISGDFSISSNGEDLYAYTDTDADPTNGITAIHSLFYTINSAIPTTANPSSVFPNAVVVSGFGSSLPNRTEYKFAASERSAPINLTNIQTTANYLIAQNTQSLSIVPFGALNLCPASITTQASNANVAINGNTQFSIVVSGTNLTYQWQVNTGAGFANIVNGGVYSGATTNTLLLTAVPCTFVNYIYRCIVNDCATSDAKTLTVTYTLAAGFLALTQDVSNPIFKDANCNILGEIRPAAPAPVAGNITIKSWVEPSASYGNVPRHYEVNPASNAANATAEIKLFFSQADFDTYNALNIIKLPKNPTDNLNLPNIQLVKYAGTSAPNNDGLPTSYVGISGADYTSHIISTTWNGQMWEIKFSTTGFSGFFIKTASSPLPVNLISFTGKPTEKGNLLTWKTANEKGFEGFEIERSSPLTPGGGISNEKFEKIGEIKSNKSESYEFLDISNLIFHNSNLNYYRLKMIDLDGKFSFSKIISIENRIGKTNVGNFYPNPSASNSNIDINANESGNWNIITYDILGKKINSETKFLQKGLNKISIEKLIQGVNFVRFENGVISEIRKVIQQ
jgi:Secretion system C-terminal sorting domain